MLGDSFLKQITLLNIMKAIILQNFLNINSFYSIFPKQGNIMKNQINNKNIEFNQKKLVKDSLPFESHQILLGSLLGDMYLRKECKNPNIEETHSTNQKDYLKWKYKILSNYFDLKLYNFNSPICKAKEKRRGDQN